MKDRKKRPFFAHYKKIFVNEFKGYNGSRLVKDILAGLTVGAVALPLALAFGADDIDGTIDDSTKIYSMAGADDKRPSMSVEEMHAMVARVGFRAIERDTHYNEIG